MTARQVYEGVLVELNKVNAPSLLLEDFNYLFNKAIYQYINKKYNIYDINQQLTDDIRVLKATAILPVTSVSEAYGVQDGTVKSKNSLFGATYDVILPTDYLHLLNCVCNFKVNKTFKCYDANSYVQFGATRLTSDLWSQIINNFYMRPSYKRPYYYIHNVNSSTTIPTNPYSANNPGLGTGTDSANVGYNPNVTLSGDPLTPTLGTNPSLNLSRQLTSAASNDLVERKSAVRYGNASEVRLEIRAGKDSSLFTLEDVYVDYLKSPQHIRLTQEQLDYTEDFSQMMEFPDYVCQEIINELVKLVMENSGDPRLQSNIAVNQTIANPVQQQPEK